MILRPPEQDYATRLRAMSPARAIVHGLLDAAIAMMFTFALVVAIFLLMGCFAEDEALGGGVEGGGSGGGESSGGAGSGDTSSTSAASASASGGGSSGAGESSGGDGSEGESGSSGGSPADAGDTGGGTYRGCDPADPDPNPECSCLVEGENTACAPPCLKGTCPAEDDECIDVEPGEGETLACVLPCDPMGLCPDGMVCIGWDDGDVGAMICMWSAG